MKKITIFSLSIAFAILANTAFSQSWVDKMQDPSVNFYEVQKAFKDYFKDAEPKFREAEKLKQAAATKQPNSPSPYMPTKGGAIPSVAGAPEKAKMSGGWKAYKRWENYMEPRLYPSGDRSVMINAWNEYLDNYHSTTTPSLNKQAISQASAMLGIQAANWTIIGPTTTIPSGGGGAGRVNFVRFDPTNTNTIYVGSPGGGLWKSTTGGTAWTTNTDNLAVIGCTDLAINPTNTQIMYLATGDGEAQDTYSIGVLKSTNGGTSWSPSGLTWAVTNGRTISRLLMNPQNPNTIFAATSNGLYRTLNAGTSWTQIASAVANLKDIEYKPGDTTVVYACSTTLFYKSINGGTSFVTTATGLPAAASLSRLAIAVTAANVNYVYILASNTAYGFLGLYRSINSGAAFTSRSTTPNILGWASAGNDTGGQGWYDLSIAASPTNAELIVVGGVNIWKSITGGSTWTINAHWTGTGAPYVHADVHALEFLPASATTYYAGCDGGCFTTSNAGGAWSDLSNGLQISQAYRIGLSKTNANLLVTGWQDNGTNRWSGTAAWARPLGGDGMEAIIDWSNASIQYGELYYGQIDKTTTGGNMTTSIVASGGTGVNADGDWVTPYIEAPSNAATLFVGKAQIYKSTTSGTSWAQVGTISGGTGNVIALANAASNINYIYAAKIDKFYASINGTSFTDRTVGLPTASAAITYIAVHPTNPSRVWVTFSGYSAANKVWYSTDAGATWTNYSTGLPNLPANCIVYQDNSANEALYVGTDVGVYYRDNTAASWTAYNTGLPNVSVRELEIQYTALKLRAATFGRGIWQSDLNTPGTSPPIADFTASQTNICIGQCISFTDISSGTPTSWSWSFTGAATTTSTLQNPTNICYNTAGTYNVTLIATNANGGNTMTKTAYITVSGTNVLPLTEGFQAAFVPAGWILNNPDVDYTWAQTATAGGFGTSTSSALMDNYSPATTIAGTIDELLTPKYSFSGFSTATLTFDVAYARYNATYKDSLRVFVSTDCGTTWTAVYNKGGFTGLQTAPDNATSAFVPTAAQWRTETVSLTPYAGLANVMVKFQNYSGWGQLLYLDNINITGAGAAVASVIIAQTTGTNPMCAGQSATFTATPTNGGTTPVYQWKVNGVNVGTNSTTYTTTTLTTGQIVTCVMTSNLAGVTGSPATSNAINMTVNAVPATPTATNTGPYCVGATITLATPAVAGATYSWTGPSAFASALQNPTRAGATVAMAGTYSVTITVAGCTSLAGTTLVVVNTTPATPGATNTGPYCAGATITLATPAVAGATYAWTGPSAFASALQNPTRAGATVAMAGTYSVTVTVAGCTSLAGTTLVVVNTTPATPTATNTGPYCAGATITLATPAVAGATYAWTGPNTFSSALQNPTIASSTLAMAGTYSVTVTIAGCTSLAGTTLVVVNTTPATPTATNTGPYCAGATITLATPAVAGATYAWTGPSAFASALQNPTRPASTVAMAGTYSVTVTVAGCTSLAGTTTVIVNPAPATPTATNTGPYCAGATITLATPAVAGATYAWTGPSAFTSALQNPTRPAATLAMAGTYSVTVTVAGCTSLAGTTAVVVNATPATPTATNTGAYCAGATITIATPAVAGATYAWSGPSAFASALQNPTRPAATLAMAGTYSVTVTVAGCTSLAGTTAVVVNATPATPTATNTGAYCAGATITLATPAVAGATYSWSGPSAFASTIQNPARPAATLAMAGTYSVTVTVAGCTSLAGTTAVVVNATPATPTATNTGAYCAGATITLATPAVAGATYAWTGPSAFASALQNPTRPASTVAMAGTYSVTVTVAGCTSLAGTTAVVVNALPTTPTASNTGAYCAGATITLATPTVAGATYAWTGPSAFASALQNPTRPASTLAMAGTYSVTVTMAGCTSLAGTTAVVVNALPATPTATNTGAYCAGATITLATPTVAGATYAWTGPSAFASAVQNPTRPASTVAMAGTYSVTVTVAGCTSLAGTTAVVVNALPATPTATNTGAYCAGATITLATPTVAGATYAWTGPSAFASAVQNPTRPASTVAMAGTYSVTITSGGCTSLAGTTIVVVNAIPATPAAGSNSPVCLGSTILLTTPIVGTATYSWTGPGAFASALQNPSLPSATAGMAGTYSITVTVSGCTSLVGTTIVAVSGSVVPTNNIVASPSGAICAGTSVTFTATAGGGGTTPGYQWQINGVDVGAATATTFTTSTLTNGQLITCILTSSSSCASPATATSNTITMTVNPMPVLSVTNPTAVCSPSTIDITAAAVTAGSTGGGTLTYWTNAGATISLTSPNALSASGTYYIKSTTPGGCNDIKPVTVTINNKPSLLITNPAAVCSPSCINITAPAVTAGSTGGGTLTYWTDAAATVTLTTPNTVCTSGTYYIKSTTAAGCIDIKPVIVTINSLPVLLITDPSAVCSPSTIDITAAAVTAGSTGGGTLTYWTNAGATISLTSPNALSASGTYYIKSTTPGGCIDIKPVTVTINNKPSLLIANPAAVCSPSCINITTPAVTAGSTGGGTLTYWTNPGATVTLTSPNTVCTSGTYYIKSTTAAGCIDIKPVIVTINNLPVLLITNPAAVCSPSTIDITAAAVTAGSTGGGTLTYWTNAGATISLTSPNALSASGTYYIKTTTSGGCTDIKPVTVTINSSPSLLITNPVAVCSPSCVDLTAPAVTAGSTGGGTLTYWTNPGATVTLTSPNAECTSGTYYIKSTTAGGCIDINPVTVTIDPSPTTPTISQAGSVLTSSSATGNQWYLNGTIISGEINQNYTFTTNGNYTVIVTTGSCSSPASSPTSITTVGISDTGNPDLLAIYPNPSDGFFTISFNITVKSTYKIELINALGQQIFKEVLNDYTGSYSKQLNIVDYGKGVYTIRLTNSKNETVKKIIVY